MGGGGRGEHWHTHHEQGAPGGLTDEELKVVQFLNSVMEVVNVL